MKKNAIIGALAAAMVLGMVSLVAVAEQDETGSGCPSGAHYNLNIIGVQNKKSADMDVEGGHVIFVMLGDEDVKKNTKIKLAEGDEFLVLDKNGTDGTAEFQLPNPDPDGDGTTVYSVFACPRGKPNGKAKVTTAATDPGMDGIFGTADDETVFSVCTLEVERTNGRQKFENVSKELLYIYAYVVVGMTDPDGIPDSGDEEPIYEFMRVSLFSEYLQDYFWSYDNNGLKMLKLRFYEVETTVPDVAEVSPTSGVQGTNDLPLTITATGIALGVTTTVTIDCADIAIDSVVKVDDDTLTVTIDIGAGALPGVYCVTITRDDGTEFIGGFEVTAAP